MKTKPLTALDAAKTIEADGFIWALYSPATPGYVLKTFTDYAEAAAFCTRMQTLFNDRYYLRGELPLEDK